MHDLLGETRFRQPAALGEIVQQRLYFVLVFSVGRQLAFQLQT
jgi:hypothetical protein